MTAAHHRQDGAPAGGNRFAGAPAGRTDAAARTAGALALAGLVAGILSVVPVLERPDYLQRLAGHERQVVSGALFQAIMVPASVGSALCLYPILRRASERLSLGFVGFRLVAATFHLLAVVLLGSFIPLGRAVAAPAADPTALGLVAEVVRTARDLTNHVGVVVALVLGDILLFTILYRWRLVPRWVAAWGFAGALAALAASLLLLAHAVQVTSATYLVMTVPMGLQSIALAGWLMTKGIDERSVPRPTR